MSFTLTLIYIAFTFLRPFDLWLTGMAEFRPMLLLWIIAFLSSLWNYASTQKMAGTGTHVWLAAGLLLVATFSSLVRDGGGASLAALNDFSPPLSIFVLVLLNATTLPRLRTLVWAFVASIAVLSCLGIYAHRTGYMAEQLVLPQRIHDGRDPDETAVDPIENQIAPNKDTSGQYMWRVRSAGTLADPNDFGQALIIAMPLLWAVLRTNRLWLQALLLALPYTLLMYTTLLTQSRGALVGLAAAGLAVFHRLFGMAVTAGLASVMALGVAGMTYGGGRALSTDEQSAAQRIDAWWAGLDLLSAYPVLGAGYGNFLDHHERTAHNSFVLCFAELGLSGFFLWCALIVLAYKGLSQVSFRPQAPLEKAERRLADGLRYALVGYLASAWFLSRTYSPGTFLMLGLAVAAWYGINTAVAARNAPAEAIVAPALMPWKLVTIMFMCAVILLTYLFVILG
jgi:putative inorganic carbon (hco3(-)) transporter